MFPTTTQLKTIAWTVGLLAAAYRLGAGDLITGRQKFLGLF